MEAIPGLAGDTAERAGFDPAEELALRARTARCPSYPTARACAGRRDGFIGRKGRSRAPNRGNRGVTERSAR